MGESHYPIGIRRNLSRLAVCLILISVPLTACAKSSGPDEPPVFDTEVEGEGNSIRVEQSGETAIFEIRSESGIGRGTVRLVSGTAPSGIVLRIDLTGLEQFRLTYDGVTVNAAASTQDPSRISQHLLSNGGEQEILPRSPYWMEIQPSARDGFLEIELPSDYFKNGTGDFSIEWIDFFR